MTSEALLFNLELLLRVFLACLCEMIIGLERENRSKFAGVRTHILVSLGASHAMIVSKYGFYDSVEFDAARIAAQIVSGIGFLGAGVIFLKKETVTGLTTVAGIWATSIIGMVLGSGLYFMGISSAIIVVIIQTVLYRNEYFSLNKTLHSLTIEANDPSFIADFRNYYKEKILR